MRMRPHPSARRLHDWLDSGGPDDIDRHVAGCSRCATRLEELAEPVPQLAGALSLTLQPPDDLVRRLGAKMTDSMRTREDLVILLELMGVPWHTVRTLMTDLDDDR